jgi:hypothetical protein
VPAVFVAKTKVGVVELMNAEDVLEMSTGTVALAAKMRTDY